MEHSETALFPFPVVGLSETQDPTPPPPDPTPVIENETGAEATTVVGNDHLDHRSSGHQPCHLRHRFTRCFGFRPELWLRQFDHRRSGAGDGTQRNGRWTYCGDDLLLPGSFAWLARDGERGNREETLPRWSALPPTRTSARKADGNCLTIPPLRIRETVSAIRRTESHNDFRNDKAASG